MRITNREFDFVIEADENTSISVVCENPKVFYEIIDDSIKLFQSNESNWIISEKDGTRIDSKQIDIIVSPFCFDINSKRLLGNVQKEIEACIYENFTEEISYINNTFVRILEDISVKLSYEIDYNIECDVKDLIKIYDLKLNYESGSLLEKLSIYIKLVAMAFNMQVLFLVDIKRYLTEYEILTLYKEARYWKIQLVIIESRFICKLENEKVIIIDMDKCIIEL